MRKLKNILWYVLWEKDDHAWNFFQTTNCYIINVGRLSIGIQKFHTWKHL